MDLIKEGLGIFVQPTGVSRKLVIDGKAKTYPVYRVRLDMLYYNDQNDRMEERKSPQGMLHGSWMLRVFFMSDKGNSFIQYKKRILPDRACRLFSSAVL